tara:strand:+ start:170086 stop:170250 length:165 start_codon:yes stop_codon:yes gene_type:complete
MITIIPYLKEKRCRYLQGIKQFYPNSKRAGGDSLIPLVALAIMMAKTIPLSAGS